MDPNTFNAWLHFIRIIGWIILLLFAMFVIFLFLFALLAQLVT